MSHRPVYNNSQKLPIRNARNSRLRSSRYSENGNDGEYMDGKDEILENEEDHKDEDKECEKDGTLGLDGGNCGKSDSNVVGQGDKYVDDEEDENDYDDDSDDDDDDDEDDRKNFNGENTDDAERHAKKRKLKSLALSYEFAPRVPPPPTETVPPPPKTRLLSGSRNVLADWTERETFVLLDEWGDRFVQRRKKILRADEWQEVAAKVSRCEASRPNRSESQCRNRLDTLKKKYKKEKSKLAEMGGSSNWVYFKKMDTLLFSSASEQTGLPCGLDSGEYVFSSPGMYLNQANGMDEMRDSPGNSESSQKAEEEEDSDGLPPKTRKSGRDSRLNFRSLACSVKKFSKLYKKIENRRTQQMIELEQMRMQFQRDLEAQRRQIMETARAEIMRIRLGDRNDDDLSNDNTSG